MDKNQREIWENIAEEWNKFKIYPAEHVVRFLEGKNGKILDLGCGSGRNLIKMKNTDFYLIDFSKNMIKYAKKKAESLGVNANCYVCDISSLPFKDNFFDAILCISVLHCATKEDREKSVKEMYRVLKPDGEVEVSVWNKNSYRFKKSPKEKEIKWRDKGKRYYYLFDTKEIYDLFEKAGFNIIFKEEPTRNIIFTAKK